MDGDPVLKKGLIPLYWPLLATAITRDEAAVVAGACGLRATA